MEITRGERKMEDKLMTLKKELDRKSAELNILLQEKQTIIKNYQNATNVTERKLLENKMKLSEAKFKKLEIETKELLKTIQALNI